MLDRAELFSALGPSIVHGFTDRNDGHSRERYASLNMGSKWGGDPEAGRRNHAAVAEAGGYALEHLVRVRQVHGAEVIAARDVVEGSEADGVWCHRDDGPCVVAVMTADCVPILLADREGSAVAALHSGWRGTVAGIATVAVDALEQAGVPPERLVAAIGPCIEQPAFEVGPEVAEHFDEAFVERSRWPKPHVDLVGVVRAQLRAAGVPADAIARVGGCTHANPERWFSYRRDGKGIGQMMSFVGVANA